jgi:hypothetical protein
MTTVFRGGTNDNTVDNDINSNLDDNVDKDFNSFGGMIFTMALTMTL